MEHYIEQERFSPSHCNELLQRFEEKKLQCEGKKLSFSDVSEFDVTNISAPFRIGNATVIAGRVEAREASSDSHIVFFEEENSLWVPTNGAPILQLEDGFATHIGDETVFGGVEVYPNPTATDSQHIGYRTVFYRGYDFPTLQKFAVGPDMMKDIRLVRLANDRIGVCTRPQGGQYGKGKIGYIELQHAKDINAQNILNAKIIENQFVPEEWGGANELHPLQDGSIGVIGHIAYQDEQGGKHYYAMSFVYDPEAHHALPIEIIATRKNFPAGPAKTSDLADIVFPGGLVRHGDGSATLYAGLSDTEAGSITIPDPFSKK